MTIREDEDKPPIFSSWKGWYWLVAISLFIWILILYLFTTAYS